MISTANLDLITDSLSPSSGKRVAVGEGVTTAQVSARKLASADANLLRSHWRLEFTEQTNRQMTEAATADEGSGISRTKDNAPDGPSIEKNMTWVRGGNARGDAPRMGQLGDSTYAAASTKSKQIGEAESAGAPLGKTPSQLKSAKALHASKEFLTSKRSGESREAIAVKKQTLRNLADNAPSMLTAWSISQTVQAGGDALTVSFPVGINTSAIAEPKASGESKAAHTLSASRSASMLQSAPDEISSQVQIFESREISGDGEIGQRANALQPVSIDGSNILDTGPVTGARSGDAASFGTISPRSFFSGNLIAPSEETHSGGLLKIAASPLRDEIISGKVADSNSRQVEDERGHSVTLTKGNDALPADTVQMTLPAFPAPSGNFGMDVATDSSKGSAKDASTGNLWTAVRSSSPSERQEAEVPLASREISGNGFSASAEQTGAIRLPNSLNGFGSSSDLSQAKPFPSVIRGHDTSVTPKRALGIGAKGISEGGVPSPAVGSTLSLTREQGVFSSIITPQADTALSPGGLAVGTVRKAVSAGTLEEPRNPFQAIDSEVGGVSGGGIGFTSGDRGVKHIAGGLEVGYQDPELGYVELHAHLTGGTVHASLTTQSAASGEVLQRHLDSLAGWLNERRTPVESMIVLTHDDRNGSRDGGTGGNGGADPTGTSPDNTDRNGDSGDTNNSCATGFESPVAIIHENAVGRRVTEFRLAGLSDQGVNEVFAGNIGRISVMA
jgi:hypothetical protein